MKVCGVQLKDNTCGFQLHFRMSYVRRSNYRNWDEIKMEQAIRKVNSKEMSLRSAAKEFSVPKSTLSRRKNREAQMTGQSLSRPAGLPGDIPLDHSDCNTFNKGTVQKLLAYLFQQCVTSLQATDDEGPKMADWSQINEVWKRVVEKVASMSEVKLLSSHLASLYNLIGCFDEMLEILYDLESVLAYCLLRNQSYDELEYPSDIYKKKFQNLTEKLKFHPESALHKEELADSVYHPDPIPGPSGWASTVPPRVLYQASSLSDTSKVVQHCQEDLLEALSPRSTEWMDTQPDFIEPGITLNELWHQPNAMVLRTSTGHQSSAFEIIDEAEVVNPNSMMLQ